MTNNSIRDLRNQIDFVDDDLVRLLNKRAHLVLQLAEYKKEAGIPVIVPYREAEIFNRIRKLNHGPLEEASIRIIFDQIFYVSRQLQQPTTKR